MRLKIIPHPQGRIEFQALLEEEGDHEHYLALLKRSAVRNPSDTVFMCSMCRAVRIDEKWRPIEAAAQELQLLVRETTPRITHVLCENCRFISRQATRRA